MTDVGVEIGDDSSGLSLSRQFFVHLVCNITFTFTFTFGKDSMLSSAEAIISYGPMRSPKITERLYKSLRGFFANLKRVCG